MTTIKAGPEEVKSIGHGIRRNLAFLCGLLLAVFFLALLMRVGFIIKHPGAPFFEPLSIFSRLVLTVAILAVFVGLAFRSYRETYLYYHFLDDGVRKYWLHSERRGDVIPYERIEKIALFKGRFSILYRKSNSAQYIHAFEFTGRDPKTFEKVIALLKAKKPNLEIDRSKAESRTGL